MRSSLCPGSLGVVPSKIKLLRPEANWVRTEPQEKEFEVLRRQDPDGSRPAGLEHEHAETRSALKPCDEDRSHRRALRFTALSRQGPRERLGSKLLLFAGTEPRQRHREPNGPSARSGMRGHKPSANGSHRPTACSACPSGHSPWFTIFGPGRRKDSVRPSLSGFSAHPFPCRVFAFPSRLAVCSVCPVQPDGKVRWQKRFVFPARRMRRGLRF